MDALLLLISIGFHAVPLPHDAQRASLLRQP